MNLIVIEDEENFACLLEQALQGLTESVKVVSNWVDALKYVDENGADMAWVDLRMPTSSEEESIERIHRLREKNDNIVIIVGSGFITPHVRAKLDRAGVDGCFYKDSGFRAEQVASLIVLGLMRATKRHPHSHDKLLTKALQWMEHKFPNAQSQKYQDP